MIRQSKPLRRSPIRIRRKKHKFAKPPNGLTFPGALDPRSRRYPDGREELRGADKSKRRVEIFERAGQYCEEVIRCQLSECNEGGKAWHTYRCPNKPTEWSHKPCIHIKVGNGHGRGFKCDALTCGIASCKECHDRFHAGKEK